LLAILAHGFDTLGLPVIVAGHGIAHGNSRKLLERVDSSTHATFMWAMTAKIWRIENQYRQTPSTPANPIVIYKVIPEG
jgi:hypothetical protein